MMGAPSERVLALHRRLSDLGVDADLISDASRRSVEDPTGGYDPKFGRSAIRAYRSFVNSSSGSGGGGGSGGSASNGGAGPRRKRSSPSSLEAQATSVARQIEHLARWHRSRDAEWVRHRDDVADSSGSDESAKNDDGGGASPSSLPLILLLDNLRSSQNVGSLFRSADACGVREVVTTGITPHPGGGGGREAGQSSPGGGAYRSPPTLSQRRRGS